MPDEHQCSSHRLFEKMMQQSLENLAGKITEGIRVFSEQSASNGEMLQKVLENQSERRALCGKQSGRIDAHEFRLDSHGDKIRTLDNELKETNKNLYIGVGLVIAVQTIVAPIIIWLITK